jgi:hypothetical protein
MKTGLLEMRPIFVLKAPRTRAHVLVTILALKVVREMRRVLVVAFGTTDDKMAMTVEDTLVALARLCLLTYHVQGTAVTRLPASGERQAASPNTLRIGIPQGLVRRPFVCARSHAVPTAHAAHPALCGSLSGARRRTVERGAVPGRFLGPLGDENGNWEPRE